MASREQHYTHLPCARTRLNTSQFKSLPLLHMYLHRPLNNMGLIISLNSQNKGAMVFSALLTHISHICVCLCGWIPPHWPPGSLSYWYVIPVPDMRKWEIDAEKGKRASGARVPTLRISSGACVCSGTATFRAGHWGSPQLCKDERIKCWDRRPQRNGRR